MNYFFRSFIFQLISITILFSSATAAPPESETLIGRRSLREEWRVTASANGFVRKESVAVDTVLRLSAPANQSDREKHRINLVTEKINVQVDVPAQKRAASFDSNSNSYDTPQTAFELIRPVAFHKQSLVFDFDQFGVLVKVGEVDPILRRINELYDRDLSGSEADLYTRDFTISLASPDYLRQVWQDLIFASIPVEDQHPSTQGLSSQGDQTPSEVPALACIPSESWLQLLQLKVRLVSETSEAEKNGTLSLRRYEFLPFSSIKSEIGPSPWNYELKAGEASTRMIFGKDRLIEESEKQYRIELNTILFLNDREIPVFMVIEHLWRIRPMS